MVIHLRNILILIIAFFIHGQGLQGNPLNKEIDQKKKMLLTEAISLISKQYNVYFTFDHALVSDITVEYETREDLSVEAAISGVLDGTDLKFKLYDRRFVILYQNDEEGLESLKEMVKHFEHIIADGPDKKSARRNLEPVTAIPLRDAWIPPVRKLEKPVLNVNGIVTDEAGEPLIGVNVQVKGSNKGTATDFEGLYTIDDVNENAILVFSYIGYVTQEIPVDGRGVIDATLLSDAQLLDEVVVVGYGTQRKGDVTGAISTVSTREIQELPITDAGEAIQGRVPGVMVLSSGNRPGDGATIRIRGRRSLTASNDPLYVVDGIPYQGNINDINPMDIKSIEILKDASATAIYGSRGANGVILITTNRGGDFPTIVSYNGYYGISSALGKPDLMNSEQYVRMREIGGRTFNALEMDAIQEGVNTDWVGLITKNGSQQNHQVSIRGGNSKTGFLVSANTHDEEAIVENQNFSRKTLRINLDHFVSDKFKIGTSLQLSDQMINYGTNLYADAITLMPLGKPYDQNGKLLHQPGADPLRWNPLMDIIDQNFVDERSKLRIFANIFAQYNFSENIKLTVNYGPDYQKNNRGRFRGALSSARKYGDPDAYKSESTTYNYTLDNILEISKNINNDHELKLTGLVGLQEYTYSSSEILVQNLPYEHQLYHNLSTAEQVNSYDSDLSAWSMMSYMARINYKLVDKYLFTVTGRYDGSSRLSEGNKYKFFPSVAFMWRIIDEHFMIDQNLLSDLSLRVSYGLTGNSAINPYQTKGSLKRTIYNFADIPAFGYRPGSIESPELKWETSTTVNIGLNFGIGTATTGSIELYQTSTSDLLLERNIPITTGYSSLLQNIGETRNRGWGININSTIIDTKNISWDINLNLFGNKEEIIDLYGDKNDDLGNGWFIGEPLTVYYDYEKLGIWQLNEKETAEKYQSSPGTIKVRDVNNDGIINQNDRVVIGSDVPKLSIGLGSRINYKNFDFSFLLFSMVGNTIYNQFEVNYSTLQGRFNNLNVNYWTEDNPTDEHPKPDASRENPLYGSSRGYQPGDFLKIKNLQIGYKINNNILSKSRIEFIRVYLNLDTPFIFSHLAQNLDPEISGGTFSTGNLSSTRMYSLGLSINL